MKETTIREMKGSTIWRNGRNSKTGDETTVIFPARREKKKSSGGFLFRRTSFIVLMKKGGYLLSRIALQYHRRKRA